MQPAICHLTIYQAGHFNRTFTWKAPVDPDADPLVYEPVDLTGYTAVAKIHVNGETLAFDSAGGVGIVTLLNLGGVDGTIELVAGDEDLALLRAGHGLWSLEVTPPAGEPDVLLYGEVTLVKAIA